MILSVDFIFNFVDDRNIPVIDFFSEALCLSMSSDRKLSIATYKTTIDPVFHYIRFMLYIMIYIIKDIIGLW